MNASDASPGCDNSAQGLWHVEVTAPFNPWQLCVCMCVHVCMNDPVCMCVHV